MTKKIFAGILLISIVSPSVSYSIFEYNSSFRRTLCIIDILGCSAASLDCLFNAAGGWGVILDNPTVSRLGRNPSELDVITFPALGIICAYLAYIGYNDLVSE